MRAWIEYPSDTQDADDHDIGQYASVCEYVDGVHDDETCLDMDMSPKSYYIEYELHEHPDGEIMSEETVKVKVPVDISGLTNEQVVDLITALNYAGFEAVLRTNLVPSVLENDKW